MKGKIDFFLPVGHILMSKYASIAIGEFLDRPRMRLDMDLFVIAAATRTIAVELI
ncbi:hypothetical protein [Mesorhizobium sp. DCY119]|uniref:hypothetical protein n=1 Tax=Mesorhizobium sp. DCY119 TaxID=2108445 RepID=UPI001401D4D7|nr:hypothetical protein [Mesorhizobium sp. DCY119]